MFCICSLINSLFFRWEYWILIQTCSNLITCLGMPPAKQEWEEVQEGLAQFLIPGTPRTQRPIWVNKQEFGRPWMSAQHSQEQYSAADRLQWCLFLGQILPTPWNHWCLPMPPTKSWENQPQPHPRRYFGTKEAWVGNCPICRCWWAGAAPLMISTASLCPQRRCKDEGCDPSSAPSPWESTLSSQHWKSNSAWYISRCGIHLFQSMLGEERALKFTAQQFGIFFFPPPEANIDI